MRPTEALPDVTVREVSIIKSNNRRISAVAFQMELKCVLQ